MGIVRPRYAILFAAMVLALPYCSLIVFGEKHVNGKLNVDLVNYSTTQSPALILLTFMIGAALLVPSQRRRDLPLLLVALYGVITSLRFVTVGSIEQMSGFALAVVTISLLRYFPARFERIFIYGLFVNGGVQVVQLLLSRYRHDYIVEWLYGITVTGHRGGTFGNADYLSFYFALCILLAHPVLWPIFTLGIILTQSFTGVVVLLGGLFWRYQNWYSRSACILAIPIGLYVKYLWFPKSFSLRFHILQKAWEFWGINGWSSYIFGNGFGSWAAIIAQYQISTKTAWQEVYVQMHNDPFQFVFELGLLALVGVLVWIALNYSIFKTIYGAPLIGSLVGSFVMFPFHLAINAAPILVILAFATRRQRCAV